MTLESYTRWGAGIIDHSATAFIISLALGKFGAGYVSRWVSLALDQFCAGSVLRWISSAPDKFCAG